MAYQAYQARQFERAITTYQAIVDAGLQHSTLYYNLGNAYFKQGDIGRAILNYRLAQSLAPRDNDIAINLAIARAHTVDQLAETRQGVMANVAWLTDSWLTMGEAKILLLGLWLCLTSWIIVSILWQRWQRFFGIMIAVFALFLFVGLSSVVSRLYIDQFYRPVIVVAKDVEVTSGPGAVGRYSLEFKLQPGVEAHLLERRGSWYHLALPNNLSGWVSAEAVKEVRN